MKKTSAIFWVFLIVSLPSWAENTMSALGEQAQTSLDARKKANYYSFNSGGIGIFISYGTKNGVTAEEIGDKFVKEIKRRGVKSKYFFYNAGSEGMAMEIYIGYSAMGPWNVDHAASDPLRTFVGWLGRVSGFFTLFAEIYSNELPLPATMQNSA